MPARFGFAHVFAELHDDANLVWVDAEGEGPNAHENRQRHTAKENDRTWQSARTATATAGHHAPQFFLAALQQFLKIWRLIIARAAAAALSPGAATLVSARSPRTTATTTTTALVVPRHR